MQSLTDFNAVSNCLKGTRRHEPVQRAIEDKQRRRKYLSIGNSKRGHNVSRSVFAQSGSLFVREKQSTSLAVDKARLQNPRATRVLDEMN